MTKQAGGPSSLISVPKGGGALQGMGEKFSPDLFTGTGNFTVPIAIPPGRNGFQPGLNLVYSTGNGNGPFGLGWSLSIPGVSRKTSKGVPRYDDESDVFILSGAEDLVPTRTEEGVTSYRPRTEGLFARIEHHRDTENDYWKVCSKDGLTSYYGSPRPEGAAPDWQDPAVVTDPADRTRIFAWKLSRTEDPFGNRIIYEYESDAGEAEGRHWNQLYLRRIRYIDYRDAAGTEQYLVSVTFDYGDPAQERPDSFSGYRAGFEIRTRRRCQGIETSTHADRDRRVRSYRFVYLDERTDIGEPFPLNNVSLLSRIRVTGHDDEQPEAAGRTQELPPLEFGYTGFDPGERDFFPVTGSLPARSLADPSLELVDLFGSGLPDILELNGSARYWRNLGSGRFDLPHEMGDAPAGLSLGDAGVQLIDADGDGRTDLLVTTEGISGYYPTRFGGLWDRRSFQRYGVVPSFNLEDPEVRLVDLTGDGVTDAIRSGTRLECFFNDPMEGWGETRRVERGALEAFPNINFSDPRVKWADMSGDGLTDIVLINDGNVEYWPNLGHGNWGRRIAMRNCPRFPYGYDPRRILVGDVDGDGLADILYVDDTRVTLWVNQNGNRWSAPIEIPGTPPVTDMDAVRLADMLGTGILGVLWTKDAEAAHREHYFFLDFTGSAKPYLLREMDNHMGAITRVEYAPSTRFYLEDQTRLETRWKTPLPFPVQVVAAVEVIDHFSRGKLTTEYTYHHGYWDGAEREFRGFGRVDQRDTEVFERYHGPGLHPGRPFAAVEESRFSPPLETRTWFHQGPVGDEFGEWEESDYSDEFWPADPNMLTRPPEMETFLRELPRRVRRDVLRTLRGRILRSELFALDGTARRDRPYTVTEYLHGVSSLPIGEEWPAAPEEWQERIFFPHLLGRRTTQWERGEDPMTHFSFAGDYDEIGQPQTQTAIACPRGWRTLEETPGQPFLATCTRTRYARPVDEDHYIMDRVAGTTTYEIRNEGDRSVPELRNLRQDDPALETIGQTLNFYDGEAFTGRAFGEVGDHGTLMRTETLTLTEAILAEAYPEEESIPVPPEAPPYFSTAGAPAWPGEYPAAFTGRSPTDSHEDPTRPGLAVTPLGYGFAGGGGTSPYARGYFVPTLRQCYDFQDGSGHEGLPTAIRDPLGQDDALRDITIGYEAEGLGFDLRLLPTRVTDPIGLSIRAGYNYRVLQPRQTTDPNGNRTTYGFTPLGLLASTAVMGKEGEPVGDTPDLPGTRLEYDLLAFMERGSPVSVSTIRREHHANDLDTPLPERDETITTVEYSDGFGRLLQRRTQAEDVTFGDSEFGGNVLPADQSAREETVAAVEGRRRAEDGPPNVIVSGWQIYDNKGRVVEKYEPFFSTGWDYLLPTEAERGQRAGMRYDPRGRVIRTVNPNGSELRVVYGVPGTITTPDLIDPDRFEPTPWESYSYDENDNAGRTHAGMAGDYPHYLNTPANVLIDALGRPIVSTERNRSRLPDGTWSPAIEEYRTESGYDIRGNLLSVCDALGREAFSYVYNLIPKGDEDEKGGPQVLRIGQLDGGVRRMVQNAAGNEIERRDSKGALILHAYDMLNRPLFLWARDDSGSAISLRGRLEYGDGSDRDQPPAERETNRANNRLGRPSRHFDEAGLQRFEAYDFKGNVLEKVRQVIGDSAILSVFEPRPTGWRVPTFRVDWHPAAGAGPESHAGAMLDPAEYRTSITYDALNRVSAMIYPEDVDGERKEMRPSYNRAGALERVYLDGNVYVGCIAYDAKGQRTLITYGNGVITRYAYDPLTFRLSRLRSEYYEERAPFTYRPRGRVLQDYAYVYDPGGNILSISDRTPGSGVPATPLGTDALDRLFEYDPLYRLETATGRECGPPPTGWPPGAGVRCADITDTRGYTERYEYDHLGNISRLRHVHHPTGGPAVVTNRDFALVPGSNRLDRVTVGGTSYAYRYDENGNMTSETESRHFEWDHSDRMRAYRTQTAGAEPSVHAHYLYDSAGQRVKKLVRKQGGQVEVTVYIDGIFEHRQIDGVENNELHVMDDQRRIAMVRVGRSFEDDAGPDVRYQLGDHLENSNVVVDAAGGWINREEYTPYGECNFGGYTRKRYRFTGKERDEESGLSYHGARYYAPWIMRWTTNDPKVMADSTSYSYTRNNPIRYQDISGRCGHEGCEEPEIPIQPLVHPAAARQILESIPGAGAALSIGLELTRVIQQLTQDEFTLLIGIEGSAGAMVIGGSLGGGIYIRHTGEIGLYGSLAYHPIHIPASADLSIHIALLRGGPEDIRGPSQLFGICGGEGLVGCGGILLSQEHEEGGQESHLEGIFAEVGIGVELLPVTLFHGYHWIRTIPSSTRIQDIERLFRRTAEQTLSPLIDIGPVPLTPIP